jgi:transglutaminase-like putative cysteine protease
MKKTNYLIIFLSLLFISKNFSQKINYASLLIPAKLKEDANAVVRDNVIKITIEAINKMTVYKKEVVTVLNKLGNVDARIGASYDNDTKITKLSAVIYDAFGKQIKKYSKGKFLDVSAVSGGTLYSDARYKYINYTPVSYPYTLVFESEYKTGTTGFIPSWFPINGYHISVEKSAYQITNPKAIPWRKKENNFEGFGIEKDISETKIRYTTTNQKALDYENNAVHYREILPKAKISLSSFYLKGVYGEHTNWNEFGKWMHDKLLVGRDNVSEATKTTIKELVKGVEDPIEKAKLVYKFVQHKTRYISVQVGIGGWEPIAALQVDKVGYGDCKGLSNYTKALLDIAEVPSYYTIVYAQEKRNIDSDFSSMQGNHIIINIPNNGNDVWLECTNQTMPFGFLGDFTDDRDVLVVTPEGGIIKRTASYANEKNLQTIKGTIQLQKDGTLKATFKRVSKGLQYDDKQGYETLSKEELIKNYKSKDWSYNNNLEIKEAQLKNDKENIVFTEDIDANINNYANINDTEYLFRVNVFNKENFVPKRYRTRKLPLKIATGYKDVDEYKIKIPEEYTLEKLPEEKKLATKFGSYKVTLTKSDDTSFTYKKTIIIKEGVYPKEDYKLYRNFRRSIAKYENLRIAITKK